MYSINFSVERGFFFEMMSVSYKKLSGAAQLATEQRLLGILKPQESKLEFAESALRTQIRMISERPNIGSLDAWFLIESFMEGVADVLFVDQNLLMIHSNFDLIVGNVDGKIEYRNYPPKGQFLKEVFTIWFVI